MKDALAPHRPGSTPRRRAVARRARTKPTTASREVPASLRWHRRSPYQTITLREPRLPAGELLTTQLLDAALALLTHGRHRPGDWRLEGWFLRVALQAVCEAILEDGRLTLPIAAVLETHPHKETWPPRPRIPLPVAISQGSTRQEHRFLRLRIRRLVPCGPGEPPLEELLDAALNVLASGYHLPGRWRQEGWFLRQGLRAVCEAVLLSPSGGLPLPLRVQLSRRDNDTARPALRARLEALALTVPPANPSPGR